MATYQTSSKSAKDIKPVLTNPPDQKLHTAVRHLHKLTHVRVDHVWSLKQSQALKYVLSKWKTHK